jgi:hypothetical protein
MVVEDMDEVVSVRADFSGGEITPRAFRRGRRSYRVTAVNARWEDREGGRPSYHFSVEAEGDTYFLGFHTGDMLWRLEKVIIEG